MLTVYLAAWVKCSICNSVFVLPHCRSDYPLKKVKYENKLELLNGVQDIRGNSNSWQNHKPLKASTPQAPAPDPYEFSDDSSINPASISRSSIRNSRDEMYHRPSFNKGVSCCYLGLKPFHFLHTIFTLSIGTPIYLSYLS